MLMHYRSLAALLSFTVSLAFCSRIAAADRRSSSPEIAIDWPAFLGSHDLVWEELPRQWNEGAFVGNGQVGLMLYSTPGDNRLDFHMGRVDVTDHRKAPDLKTSLGVKGASVMYDFPRLDVGRMALRPAGKIVGGRLRQNLWDAEITGTVTTELGELRIRCLTPRDSMVNIVEVESTEKDASGRPLPWSWEFRAGNPASPRAQVFPDRRESKEYQTNPAPVFGMRDGVQVCVQSLLAGGDFASAWLEQPVPGARRSILSFSTANEVPRSGVSAGVAVRTVLDAVAAGQVIEVAHRAWWHAFYQQSFLSIPDARMESFYWIQLYKMASCSRPDGEAVDLFGPFFRVSQWPGLWWNLNIQLTYWPFYASNHLELGENFLALMDAQTDALLRDNGGGILGDKVWALHNYWLHLRHAGDWQVVRSRWLPKAEKALACYRSKLVRQQDGHLHLTPMGSPEYNGFKLYPDTNYNIALLNWLLGAMIEVQQVNGISEPRLAEWERLRLELVPFQVDENGLKIAANQPVDMSHRHYSHLLGLYPLFQLNPDSPGDRALVEKSVAHWHRIGGGKGLAGYSFTGASSLYSALGKGDEAWEVLNTFLTGDTGISSLLPNTFYVESQGRNPVIETPLSAAVSTIEFLLQSWGGKIRVFPAVPSAWERACFYTLRAQGGFLVSAERRDSRTAWVAIESLKGEPCVLKVPDWKGPLQVDSSRPMKVEERIPGEYVIDLKAGERVLLAPPGQPLRAVVSPCLHAPTEANLYGVKAGKNLPKDQSWPLPEYGVISPRP